MNEVTPLKGGEERVQGPRGRKGPRTARVPSAQPRARSPPLQDPNQVPSHGAHGKGRREHERPLSPLPHSTGFLSLPVSSSEGPLMSGFEAGVRGGL